MIIVAVADDRGSLSIVLLFVQTKVASLLHSSDNQAAVIVDNNLLTKYFNDCTQNN